MDKVFADRIVARKQRLIRNVIDNKPSDYMGLLVATIAVIRDAADEPRFPVATECVVVASTGEPFQEGDLYFLICTDEPWSPACWITHVSYGSCSGCDAFADATDRRNTEQETAELLYTLAVHLVQRLKMVSWED